MSPETLPRAAVVVLAGGSGSRLGARLDGVSLNKVYLPLNGRPVLAWSLHAADQVPGVVRLVLVVRAEDAERAAAMLREDPVSRPVEVVTGGATRHGSEDAAMARLAPAIRAGDLDVVAVHDGARPLATSSLFAEVIKVAATHGGAVPAVTSGPLLPHPDGVLVRVQTPQAFRAPALLEAYSAAARDAFEGTDTASGVQAYTDLEVRTVPGSASNLKVTYPDDVAVAERVLAARTASA
ncbi:MAG: 2-C-methyl-D-erythritol 4-phosphate cytidylyltransferase [Kineosporiaceae bacterium]